MKRDRHGRFLPKSGSPRRAAPRSRATEASPPRKPRHVPGYYRHDPRSGRAVYVKPHHSREAAAPRRAPRAAAPAARAPRRPRNVPGYYRHDPRSGRSVYVAPHRSREPSPRRSPGRSRAMAAYSPRAMSSPRSRGTARMAPVLGAAGMSLLMSAGLLGDLAADAGHRFMVTVPPLTDPKTLPLQYQQDGGVQMYNTDMVNAPPGFASVGVQLLLAVLGIGAGALIKGAAWKFIFYGFGLGAGLHLGTQLVRAYILAPMLINTNYGQRNYEPELRSKQNEAATKGPLNPFYMPATGAFDAYVAPPKTTGLPGSMRPQPIVRRAGQPPAALPEGQPSARIPVALASLAEREKVPAATGAPAPEPRRAEVVDAPAAPKPTAEPFFAHPMWSAMLDNAANA